MQRLAQAVVGRWLVLLMDMEGGEFGWRKKMKMKIKSFDSAQRRRLDKIKPLFDSTNYQDPLFLSFKSSEITRWPKVSSFRPFLR